LKITIQKENKMTELKIDEYQKKAHETAEYPSGTIGVDKHAVDYIYPSLALSEEAGEVAGKFAKAVRDNQGVIDEERKIEIVKELGDVCWFVAELCTVLHVNLSDVMQKNLDKLASRKARGVIHGSGDNR
jgi:NTP pyrophosphatase (non-canonical NTP hydrolase)